MQFGRLHAIALSVFGLFLMLAQAWISLVPHTDTASSASQSPTPHEADNTGAIIHLLPGALGLVCVAGGIVFYMRQRGRPQEVPVQPIR